MPSEFRLKEPTIPEKVIENDILEYLWRKKVFSFKVQTIGVYDSAKKVYRKSNNPFHIKGISDILGILPGGRMLAIEVKSAIGRVSPAQVSFINRINAEGGLAFVARSLKEVANRLFPEDIVK